MHWETVDAKHLSSRPLSLLPYTCTHTAKSIILHLVNSRDCPMAFLKKEERANPGQSLHVSAHHIFYSTAASRTWRTSAKRNKFSLFFFCILNNMCCSYEQEIEVHIKEKSVLWIMLHFWVR